MKEFYVYRFKNEENEIIYVGKTKNLKQRLSGHFGKQGHLPEKCYKEVRKVEFLTFEKESLMGIKELYYISTFQPKYNIEGKKEYLYFEALEQGDEWREYLYAKKFINETLSKRELELLEENATLRQQIINLRENLTREYSKEMEKLKKNYNEINEVKNKFVEWNIEKQRIISAYERKVDWVWCKHRNKLVRKYDEQPRVRRG